MPEKVLQISVLIVIIRVVVHVVLVLVVVVIKAWQRIALTFVIVVFPTAHVVVIKMLTKRTRRRVGASISTEPTTKEETLKETRRKVAHVLRALKPVAELSPQVTTAQPVVARQRLIRSDDFSKLSFRVWITAMLIRVMP